MRRDDSHPPAPALTIPDYYAKREQILRDLVNAGESEDPVLNDVIQLARYIEPRRPKGT